MAVQSPKYKCTSGQDRSRVIYSDPALDVMQSHFCVLLVTGLPTFKEREDTEQTPPWEQYQEISNHFFLKLPQTKRRWMKHFCFVFVLTWKAEIHWEPAYSSLSGKYFWEITISSRSWDQCYYIHIISLNSFT